MKSFEMVNTDDTAQTSMWQLVLFTANPFFALWARLMDTVFILFKMRIMNKKSL